MGKIVLLALYVVVMLGIGYWAMKRTKNIGDFFLGGRQIGPWMSAFAYGTTYFSAVLFIGYAGKLGWGFGLHTMWIVLGNAIVGSLIAWWVLGKRTRIMTAKLNSMTMPDFLASRYNCQLLKTVSALIIFVFLVPYSASVYTGLSYLIGVNFNVSYEFALAFLAVLTGVYIMMGGYLALTITDFIRGIIELFGVLVMVIFLADKVGGFSHATTTLMKPEYAPALKATIGGFPGWVTLASLVIITSFGPWGLPQMVQKFYSIKSELHIKSAMIVCTIFALLMAFGAYYTGALTHLFYQVPPSENIDELMPIFLTQKVPELISLVILFLVFSASMSSLSSLVLVSSSAIAMDLYGGVIKPNAPKQTVMTLMRVLCGVFVIASLFIALEKPTIIVNLMVISWGVLAGAFAAPYVYGLFWRRANAAGAIAGLFTGLLIAVGLFISRGKDFIPIAGAIAIIVPFIVVPIVSLITKPMSKELIARAFDKADAV